MNTCNAKKGKVQKPAPLRIMIKLGWNNRRISVPQEVKLDKKTTLSHIINSVNDDEVKTALSVNGSEDLSVLYLRNSTRRSEWNTKLTDVIGEGSGGNVLLTLTKVSDSSSAPTASSTQPSVATSLKTENKVDSVLDTRKTEPMEISNTPENNDSTSGNYTSSNSPATCETALQSLFSSHFTSDIRDCVLTLIKIIDNIISKPGDERVRSIRINNPNIKKKVTSKTGAIEFLIACGFTCQGLSNDEKVVLLPHDESIETLISARELARNKCLKELSMTAKEFPPLPSPPTTGLQQQQRQQQPSFDPYKPFNYNTQAAMHGVNATSLPSQALSSSDTTYISPTQKSLDFLTAKAKHYEKSLDAKPFDRELTAHSPATSTEATSHQEVREMQSSGGKGDGALLALRMKKMEEERKQRENAGFTTKAMRDLEKLKKQKLYKHSQLRIFFPDGYSLCCNFKPNETIAIVKEVITSTFVTSETILTDFDLYITPPRTVLKNLNNTLLQEQLVPAARVFVSWKKDVNLKDYIQSQYFKSSAAIFSVPDGKNLVNDATGNNKKKRNAGSGKDSSSTKEELLLRKMLGGKNVSNSTAQNSSKESNNDSKKNWKPKWL